MDGTTSIVFGIVMLVLGWAGGLATSHFYYLKSGRDTGAQLKEVIREIKQGPESLNAIGHALREKGLVELVVDETGNVRGIQYKGGGNLTTKPAQLKMEATYIRPATYDRQDEQPEQQSAPGAN